MAGLIQRNLDTDSENEGDSDEMLDPAKPWMGGFKRYLDTMDVVQLECNTNHSLAASSLMPRVIQCGVITSPSWLPPFRVNVHFHLQELLSASDVTG